MVEIGEEEAGELTVTSEGTGAVERSTVAGNNHLEDSCDLEVHERHVEHQVGLRQQGREEELLGALPSHPQASGEASRHRSVLEGEGAGWGRGGEVKACMCVCVCVCVCELSWVGLRGEGDGGTGVTVWSAHALFGPSHLLKLRSDLPSAALLCLSLPHSPHPPPTCSASPGVHVSPP
jgi:hypothetical protein